MKKRILALTVLLGLFCGPQGLAADWDDQEDPLSFLYQDFHEDAAEALPEDEAASGPAGPLPPADPVVELMDPDEEGGALIPLILPPEEPAAPGGEESSGPLDSPAAALPEPETAEEKPEQSEATAGETSPELRLDTASPLPEPEAAPTAGTAPEPSPEPAPAEAAASPALEDSPPRSPGIDFRAITVESGSRAETSGDGFWRFPPSVPVSSEALKTGELPGGGAVKESGPGPESEAAESPPEKAGPEPEKVAPVTAETEWERPETASRIAPAALESPESALTQALERRRQEILAEYLADGVLMRDPFQPPPAVDRLLRKPGPPEYPAQPLQSGFERPFH